MQIAVLDYGVRDVDIITINDSLIEEKYEGSVERFLIEHCGYNPDSISYMCGDCLNINTEMNEESFGG